MPGTNTRQKQPDLLLFYCYLFFTLILPLPFGNDQIWVLGLYEVMTFLMMAAWLFLYVRGQVELSGPFNKAWPIYVLFILWLVYLTAQLGFGLTVSPRLTGSGWLMSLVYALIFFLTLALVNSRKRIKQFTGTIIFSGVFQAMYGSLMTLSGLEYGFFIKKTAYLGVATGTFHNRNHFAAYLVMCLAIGIGLMISRLDTSRSNNWKQSLRKWVELIFSEKLRLRLYLVIMVIALVLTHSRMGNTAFFASLFITGIIGLALSRHATRGTVILLTSLIIIDLFIVGTWFGIDKVAERLENTSIETEERTYVDQQAYKLWQDNLWTGTGLGTFLVRFPEYRSQEIASYYQQTHDDYLQFATETGIIGIVLLGCIVMSSLLIALIAQYKRKDPLMRGLSFAAIMGIVAMMIHATVEFNFQIPPNAAIFIVLLALCWISSFNRTQVHV